MNSRIVKDGRGFSTRMALACAAVLIAAHAVFFSNSAYASTLLDRGDRAVLDAPKARFQLELKRIDLPAPQFHAVIATNDDETATTDAENDDLRAALKKAGTAASEVQDILDQQKIQREKLAKFHAAHDRWKYTGNANEIDSNDDPTPEPKSPGPEPSLGSFGVAVIDGLPGEFADYFRGSIAWHAGRTNEARAEWEKVLELPAAERHYRSTWAAYMLGRSWENEDPVKAAEFFQKTRSLASSGFVDSMGLATASLGREAALELRAKRYETAIELYLDQYAAGDDTARNSLLFTASKAMGQDDAVLAYLARNPLTRRVINSYVISGNFESDLYEEGSRAATVDSWLSAVASTQVEDSESAEQLALAAYQQGRIELAQHWLDRSPVTPATLWLRSKLVFSAGKFDEGASVLADVAKLLPLPPADSGNSNQPALVDSLYASGHTSLTNQITAPVQVLGEMGVLHLVRREYVESLDAFMRAGYWEDAAYVAERVLTPDELKAYVDRKWPAVPENDNLDTNAPDGSSEWLGTEARLRIRHLLARRLTRLQRADEARAYYPADLQTNFDAFEQALTLAWDESRPATNRAQAFFDAAKIVHASGLHLLGTEVEPDWHLYDGEDEDDLTVEFRATNSAARLFAATQDEIQRALAHGVNPEHRFHYRYQAASLAWEAAKLMPNNSDETAVMLCRGGSWIKDRDPQTADFFYKTLVRRCRKTAIGAQADRMRWFPVLDEHDQIVPWNPPPLEDSPGEVQANDLAARTDGGYWYVLRHGNSLRDVADAVRTNHGVTVTVAYIEDANPRLNPARLPIGLKIFVPLPPPDHPAPQ